MTLSTVAIAMFFASDVAPHKRPAAFDGGVSGVRMTADPKELAERLRLRLRRNPGHEIAIDGKKTQTTWPTSFIPVASDLFAEAVLEGADVIETFPMSMWNGTRQEILQLAWARTLNRTKYEIHEYEAGLDEPLLVIKGQSPYLTSFALNPTSVFKHDGGQEAFAALVAIPAPDVFLLHLFMKRELPDAGAIAIQMANIARELYEACDETRRISPTVYIAYANQGLQLKKYPMPATWKGAEVKFTLEVPASILSKLNEEARRADTSLSRVVALAWKHARARISAAPNGQVALGLARRGITTDVAAGDRRQALWLLADVFYEMKHVAARLGVSVSSIVQIAFEIALPELNPLPTVNGIATPDSQSH